MEDFSFLACQREEFNDHLVHLRQEEKKKFPGLNRFLSQMYCWKGARLCQPDGLETFLRNGEGTLCVTPVTTNLWLIVLFTPEKPESFSSRSALLPLFELPFEYIFTRLILVFPESTNPSAKTSCQSDCIHREMIVKCAAPEFTNRQLFHSYSTSSSSWIYAACVVHCDIQIQDSMYKWRDICLMHLFP